MIWIYALISIKNNRAMPKRNANVRRAAMSMEPAVATIALPRDAGLKKLKIPPMVMGAFGSGNFTPKNGSKPFRKASAPPANILLNTSPKLPDTNSLAVPSTMTP